MGVDLVQFVRLCDLARRIGPREHSLMLGRQKLRYRQKGERFFRRALANAGHRGMGIEGVQQEDGYSEKFFEVIGFGRATSLDFSAYEGAEHVYDLNQPVPAEMHEKFDLIFDGGTLEHVFNTPIALQNCFHMLKPGGVFASANGMNGWWGHGLYQFGPDLVWSFWKRGAGCEVLNCMALPIFPKFPPLDLPDPADKGKRLRRLGEKLPSSRVYLYYEIQKTEASKLSGIALQSDYEALWSRRARRTPDTQDAYAEDLT